MYKPNMILWRTALQVFILVITVAWIYTPALNGEFLWDDTFLLSGWAVKSNSWGGLASIWFEPEGVDYFPITYTVLWLEWTAFGTNTFGYHLVNVLLHLSSCFLLWILLNRLKLHGAWLSALIYGIHPVCVESVAWISEIKNTLSLPFFLLTCLFWIKYDELRYKVRFNGYYYLSLGFFTVAMLAKPSVVATPFLALLYEWWKRGTVSRYGFYRVVPLFLIALVLGLITLSFQWERAIGDYTLPIGGVASRFAVAGMAIIFYCTKVFWPFNLMPMYPQWSVEPPQIWHLVPWVIISTVCFLLWLNRRGWGRDVIFAVGFFLLMLLPVLGFLNFSFMMISWVSDHFLYVPMIGLIAVAVSAWTNFFQSKQRSVQLISNAFMFCVISTNILLSHSYAKCWTSARSLWTYTLSKNDNAWQAHSVIGNMELGEGKIISGLKHLEKASTLKPNDLKVQINFAKVLLENGEPQRAATILEKVAGSSYSKVMETLIEAWVEIGKNSKAIKASEKILAGNPANSLVRLHRGRAFLNLGDTESAKKEFGIILEIDDENQEAQDGLAKALLLEN